MLRSVAATPSPCRSHASIASARCSPALSSGSGFRELVPLPPEESQKDPLLGRNILKTFDGRSFYGLIVGIDVDAATGERHYHVAYEDEDEEHLLAAEVQPLLQPGRISVGPSPAASYGVSPAVSPGLGMQRRLSQRAWSASTTPVPTSCRRSFSISRAATPRRSAASQESTFAPSRLSFAMRSPMRKAFFGRFGHDFATDEVPEDLHFFWHLAAVALVVFFVVCIVPSCLSFPSRPSTPDSSNALDLMDAGALEWPLPSNHDLLNSPSFPSSVDTLQSGTDWSMPSETISSQVHEATRHTSAYELSESPPASSNSIPHTWTRLPERDNSESASYGTGAAAQEATPFVFDVGRLDAAESDVVDLMDQQHIDYDAIQECLLVAALTSVFAFLVLWFCWLRRVGAPPVGCPVDGRVMAETLARSDTCLDYVVTSPHGRISPSASRMVDTAYTSPSHCLALACSPHIARQDAPCLGGSAISGNGGAPSTPVCREVEEERRRMMVSPAVLSSRLPSPMPLVAPVQGKLISAPQIGAYYVAMINGERKVGKATQANVAEEAVVLRLCDCRYQSRVGQPTFRLAQSSCQVQWSDVTEGPFALVAGRAPPHIAQIFMRSQGEDDPPRTTTPFKPAVRNEFCEMPRQRFRYPSALRAMEEMGFTDSIEIREIITKCRGNVNHAMSELWENGN